MNEQAAAKAIVKNAKPQSEAGSASWCAHRPFAATLIAGTLLWLAMPPLGHWPLALIAPLPLVELVRAASLPRKSLRKVWLASWAYWAATLYFIPIPHPALWVGWILLSLYCSIYLPAFVGLARVATHRLGLPVLVVVPVVWVGLEYFRANFLTGFGLALLGHALYKVPIVIQIADIFGAYTISFALMLLATSLVLMTFNGNEGRKRLSYACVALGVAAITLGYGAYRLSYVDPTGRAITVAVLQGNIDTVFPSSEEEAAEIERQKILEYRTLASDTRIHSPEPNANRVQLIIWPEGKFMMPEFFAEDQESLGPITRRSVERNKADFAYFFNAMQSVKSYELAGDEPGILVNEKAIPCIVGTMSLDQGNDNKYNSALLVNSQGEIEHQYLKMHRVLIGEYIPFERQFPFLAKLSPSGQGLSAGREPQMLELGDFKFCPNICFESCVPHLIRYQINDLAAREKEPDYIVNLSDDGWFYGTSCLDFHLMNTVLRAVENRKPTVAAANTGISAFIDGSGRLLATGGRREIDLLIEPMPTDTRYSPYRVIGDWPPFIMCLVCCWAFLVSMRDRFVARKQQARDVT